MKHSFPLPIWHVFMRKTKNGLPDDVRQAGRLVSADPAAQCKKKSLPQEVTGFLRETVSKQARYGLTVPSRITEGGRQPESPEPASQQPEREPGWSEPWGRKRPATSC